MCRNRRNVRLFELVAISLLALLPNEVAAQRGSADTPAPLGRVSFDPSCAPEVKEEFERGLALLHHMTYPGAYASFEHVTELDEGCALAYWGMAMTLFQPLWPTRPTASDLERGWELIRRARSKSDDQGPGHMLVATGEAFFNPAGSPDYWTRIRRWADATAELHRAYPDNLEAKALHALALLATASLDGDPAASHARAADMLSEILSVEPRHPGAVHYTIHANDFAGRADLSLAVVRSYGEIAPENPHALHMPTHIFVRLGLWNDVIDWNLRAAEAALAQRAGPSGEYVWDEYPHATEYLVYAYLQKADDEAARKSIAQMRETPDLEPSFKTAFHITSTAARYALERRAWKEAADLPVRPSERIDWDRFPWPEATTWFARGMGAINLGDPLKAAESARRLAELRDKARDSGEAVFVAPIEIMRLELAAEQELEDGDPGGAIERMQEAVALAERTPKHPVTPGATLPAKELLGDLYLQLDMPEQALATYRASNDELPGRFNTILGLARAHSVLGDHEEAERYYRQLLAVAPEQSEREALAEARAFVGVEAR